jgi:hypothetical protein
MKMAEPQWVQVFTTNIQLQAEMLKQMLEANGIEAVVINKQDTSYPSIGEAELYVNPENEEVAKKLLDEFEN